ncbi:MAG TPA: hypothetical protein VHW01_29360 [Polyangiaceae bacterium]|jgi:hypothetical protein|nr:hypothetical protein [Polyangiaceae bacterium]
MSERTPDAQRLLGMARREHEPSAADEARVRSSLHARVLANPLLLSAKGVHAAKGAQALLSSGKLTLAKLALAIGVCGGAGLAVHTVVSHGRVAEVVAAHQLPVSTAARRSLGSASAAAVPTARVPGEPEEVVKAPEIPAPPSQAPAPSAKRPPGSALLAPLTAQDMKLEIAGLRQAQQLLHGGNAAQAVSALDQLSSRVPTGALMEERAATRVIALCTLGRVSEAGVAAFMARYPSSVHAARVRGACGAE